MVRIMFVCLGNICRSPMAEYMFKRKLTERGIKNVEVASAATSDEEVGNPVYPPAKALLKSKGIDCSEKRARQLKRSDGDKFDLFICMDSRNVRHAKAILGEAHADKCVKMLSFVRSDADVADPWYTGDFETCYDDIERGLNALMETLPQE